MLLLLQRMELLLAKAAEEDLKRHILPLIYNAIGSETTRIQARSSQFSVRLLKVNRETDEKMREKTTFVQESNMKLYLVD